MKEDSFEKFSSGDSYLNPDPFLKPAAAYVFDSFFDKISSK